MQLASMGKVANSVPFCYKGFIKMTLYKGQAALDTRRAVASTLTHALITALQRPRRVDDKPDWAPMQHPCKTVLEVAASLSASAMRRRLLGLDGASPGKLPSLSASSSPLSSPLAAARALPHGSPSALASPPESGA